MAREDGAERQLSWSREYLRKERRGCAVRRTVFTLLLAMVLGVGVYAASPVDGGFWSVFAPSPPGSGASGPDSVSASRTGSSGAESGSGAAGVTGMCVVTFDARGGTMAEDSASVAYGARVPEPEPPERAGYGFGGWYTDVARTRVWDFAKNTVLEDITLYARWELAEPAALPETGVRESASFWATVVVAALALAAVLALLLRRLGEGQDGQ